ncbi:MAG: sodium:proton exchanger [Alphaproteobacteria bacterium]|nr:MAG: sodium:proton exchanger [Alphaproteobacteria bacterium]
MASEFSTSGLSDALVILGAAGIVIPAFARVRISPVIGFILIGILVGPFGLGAMTGFYPWLNYVTITDAHAIEPFAELGITLLLFSIGLELSFRRLWGMRRLVFGVGGLELTVSALFIGAAIYFAAGSGWAAAVALGLALALSSTAVVLPLVGTASPVGRAAFAMLLFEDLALVPIVFALGALAPHAGAEGFSGLLNTLLVGGAVVAVMLVLGRFVLPSLFAQAARTKSPELFLSVSLLVVIVASLATAAAGLSPIVGALVAGVLIAETEYHGEVEVMMAPFRGLGLGVFLITVGMSVDLAFIAGNWQALLFALVGVMLLKTLVTATFLRLDGARRAVAAETGLLMASPSETTLIVLAAAAAAGVIARDTASFWQVVTAMGLTLTPLLARVGRDAAQRIERGTAEDPVTVPTREDPRAVIVGFGRVGRLVAEMLAAHGKPYVAVDSNIDAIKAGRAEGFRLIFGDAARPELLDKLNLGHASALILTMDDPVQAVRMVKRVRAWCPDLTIVARARDASHAAELYRAGATDAVPETLESSLQLSEAALVDLGLAMGPVIASIHEKRAELRQQIMQMGEMEQEPVQRGKRLRDALMR